MKDINQDVHWSDDFGGTPFSFAVRIQLISAKTAMSLELSPLIPYLVQTIVLNCFLAHMRWIIKNGFSLKTFLPTKFGGTV